MADSASASGATAASGGGAAAAAGIPSFTAVPLDQFDAVLGTTSTEISSVALGGRILSCSDEWFAPASDLLKVEPAPSLKGQFGPKGALFSGWETRRHNPTYDWVILRLGPASGGHIVGFDVDTAHFNGNEAPEVEIFGMTLGAEEERAGKKIEEGDESWTPLLPRVPCGPSARHLFALPSSSQTQAYTHIKLHMIPDGGIARFRVYGTVPPPALGLGEGEHETPGHKEQLGLNTLDLAHVLNGGRVVFISDQHFGTGHNLLLPGRGKDMGDGWETRRSRTKGHKDWVVIKLGETGILNYAEVDTAHFLGNFPESCELHGTNFDGPLPPDSADWTSILPRTKLGPGKQHFFKLENVEEKVYTHVRLTMHPDGGIKRLRLIGRRAAPLANIARPLPPIAQPGSTDKALPDEPSLAAGFATAASTTVASLFGHASSASAGAGSSTVSPNGVPILHASRLTSDGFESYGCVIASGSRSAPHKIVNQGTARKYERLAPIASLYAPEAAARANVHVYHCEPAQLPFHVKMLERHRFTTQAFLPMTPEKGRNGYLVVVAKNGTDDRPDMSTLAVFLATTEQGISYHPGTWHHPMIALGNAPTDFACVVHESEMKPELDCDEAVWQNAVALVTA